MIAHVVLFRPRTGLSASDRQALAVSFEQALREIPSVRRATIGRRRQHGAGYEQRPQEHYPYAAIIEFDDLSGLQQYLQHTAHADPAERLFAAIEAALVVDYEMIEGANLAAGAADWLTE